MCNSMDKQLSVSPTTTTTKKTVSRSSVILEMESDSGDIPYTKLIDPKKKKKKRSRGCFRAIFWRNGGDDDDVPHDLLATITSLGNIMRDLELQNKRIWQEITKKKEAAGKLWHQGRKLEGREALKTAKMYQKTYEAWVAMRGNVERLKHQVTTQHQNGRVAQGFRHANEVMAALMEGLDIDTLNSMLDDCKDRIAEGEEVTEALSRPLDDGFLWDESQLDAELDSLIEGDQGVPDPKLSETEQRVPEKNSVQGGPVKSGKQTNKGTKKEAVLV